MVTSYNKSGYVPNKLQEEIMATFTNRATLTYNDNVTSSNIVTGEITEILSAKKTSLIDCYYNEREITYVISLVNSGTTPLTDLTVTDDLGAYTFGTASVVPLTYVDGSVSYFINGNQQADPVATATDSLVITGISIPASSNGMLIYRATVNEYAPLDETASITNTATVTGDGLVNTVSATETITACTLPRLEITKALSPTVVNDNGQITYTITLLNYGNTSATTDDNVTVTDTFNPILNSITATLDETTLVLTTDYTYDTTTGEFSTVPGRITVPAATYTQDATTGEYTIIPGTATLVITGTV